MQEQETPQAHQPTPYWQQLRHTPALKGRLKTHLSPCDKDRIAPLVFLAQAERNGAAAMLKAIARLALAGNNPNDALRAAREMLAAHDAELREAARRINHPDKPL